MSRATGRSGLRWWAALAILLLVLTVLLLPIPSVSKVWIIAVLVFAGVFTVLEAGSMGRALAALMIALLTLYLGVSFQRAWLLLGTEGHGLTAPAIHHADLTVRIPMSHGVDSLNVAAASAVAFWETRPA